MELFFVAQPVTLRLMDDEVFVVRGPEYRVDIGCAWFKMSAILHLVKLSMGNSDRRYTATREALNIALISDDFPTPDYQRIHDLNMQVER